VALHLGVVEERLDLRLEGAVEPAGALARLGEGQARPVRDRAGGLDGPLDAVGEGRVVAERLRERPEARGLAGTRAQRLAGTRRCADERRALAERERFEDAPPGGAVEVSLHLADATERQRHGGLGEGARLAHPEERLARVLGGGQEGEGERQPPAGGSAAAGREGRQDLRPAELREGPVHRSTSTPGSAPARVPVTGTRSGMLPPSRG
jgi:hypothetical protein